MARWPGRVVAADARFAEVIHGGPDEFAQDVGVVLGEGPMDEGVAGVGFGAQDDAVGKPGVLVAVDVLV